MICFLCEREDERWGFSERLQEILCHYCYYEEGLRNWRRRNKVGEFKSTF